MTKKSVRRSARFMGPGILLKTTPLLSPGSLRRRLWAILAMYGCVFFIAPINSWEPREVQDADGNSTRVEIYLSPETYTIGGLGGFLGFCLAGLWISGLAAYLSDGGRDLAFHWGKRFPRGDTRKIRLVTQISTFCFVLYMLLYILIASGTYGVISSRPRLPNVPVSWWIYWVFSKIAPGFVFATTTCAVVMIIGPVFTIVTQSQVETAWVSIAAVRDAILEPDGGEGRDLALKVDAIISRGAVALKRANRYLSRAAGAITASCIIWFLGTNTNTFLRVSSGNSYTHEGESVENFLFGFVLAQLTFAGLPFIILRKCIAPAVAWTRASNTLYGPAVAFAWAEQIPSGFAIRDLVDGLHLQLDQYGWNFFGVTMTVGLFRAVAGAMVTVIGIVMATVVRSYTLP